MPFEKGKSGNPGGRPKENARVRALAQANGEKAIQKLIDLLDCGEQRTELAAAQALLDRGFGKPGQSVTVAGDEDQPLVHRVIREIVRPTNKDS